MKVRKNMLLHLEGGETREIDLAPVNRIQDNLALQFDNGVTVHVDLSRVQMNDEQREILDRLARRGYEISTEEALAEGCPLEKRLSPNEFKAISTLKAGIGSGRGGIAAGPFIDFCLHIVNVGTLVEGQQEEHT